MTGDESVSAEGAAVPTAVAAEYDAALPGEQTELAPSASETEAHTAWALDDGPEWEPPFWSAARITAAAAAAATLLTVGAVVVAFWYLRDHETVEPVAATPTSTVVPLPPPVTVTTVVVQQPPTTVTKEAKPTVEEPVVLPVKPPLAGPLPDLMPYNGQFINNLRASGWAVWNEALMAQRGHETCAMLRDGEPRSLISQKLVALEPQVTFARAMQFTNIVSASYPNCP